VNAIEYYFFIRATLHSAAVTDPHHRHLLQKSQTLKQWKLALVLVLVLARC